MDRRRALAFAGIAVAMSLFATNFIVTRYAVLTGFDRYDLVLLRYGPAALLFAPLARPFRSAGGLGWRRAVTLTLLGGVTYNIGSVAALQYAPASHGVVLNPGVTMLATQAIAWPMFRERPSGLLFAGIATILIGLIAFAGADPGAGAGPTAWIGDALFVATGAMWGLFTCLIRRWSVDPVRATAVMAVLSLPPLLVIEVVRGTRLGMLPVGAVVAQGVFQAVFIAGVAIVLYSRAAKILGPATTSLFPPTVPVAGTLLATFALGETLSEGRVGAMLVVLAGMITGALGSRAAPARQGRASAGPA